jgi:hypothetical protein
MRFVLYCAAGQVEFVAASAAAERVAAEHQIKTVSEDIASDRVHQSPVAYRAARRRGIYDDRGRLMVAMSFNSDIGDSWEWADDPHYDEKFSALGIRIGVNYVVYAMTH